MKVTLVVSVVLVLICMPAYTQRFADNAGSPIVVLETNYGDIKVELYPKEAPVTVENFLTYVSEGFYDGTVFHRVIPGFVIQGGGMTADMERKRTLAPIVSEANNGLKNLRGTLSMARTNDPNSATSQFFINLVDNSALDYSKTSPGYAVFGKVVRGLDIVDAIAAVQTTTKGQYRDVPVRPITVTKAYVKTEEKAVVEPVKKAADKKAKEAADHRVPAFPPDLRIEGLGFFEPSGNRALDGLEVGRVEFDLVNKGRGSAYNVDVNLTPLSAIEGISVDIPARIAEIAPKSRVTVSLWINAGLAVHTAERQFRLEVTEERGFDANPAIITFETQAFLPPDLRIEKIAIDDREDAEGEGYSYGNGNSIIEPNESIEVTAYVQNLGEGTAEGVKARVLLNTDDLNISCPDENKVYDLGNIESGDYEEVEFYFYTSRRYSDEEIPIAIKLDEATGHYGKTLDLGLKSGTRTPNVLEVAVTKVETREKTEIRAIEGVVELADVDKDIPKTEMDGKNTLAVIIGIESYRYAPNADFADRDAQTFYKYAKTLFAIPDRNIYLRTNDGATSGEFSKVFAEDGWIARRLKKEVTDIIVYYSGHGAPDTESENAYLIPWDIDPDYAKTGVSLGEIYSALIHLEAKSVIVFLDACFSGVSRSEEMLIAGIRPVSVTMPPQISGNEGIAILTAASGSQYSCAYPDMRHGLFTYFLLKGLRGEARGADRELTTVELFNYVHDKVSETASYLDKEQTPAFMGDSENRVLVRY